MRERRIRRKRCPDPSNSKEQLLEEFMASVVTIRGLIEPILQEMYPPGRRGRPPGYPIFAIFLGLLYRHQTKSLRGLCRELTKNRRLLQLTGLQRVPPHQTFSNYLNRLGEDRLQRISEVIVKELRIYWPEFGKVLTVDGTVTKAYAHNDLDRRSSSDPDARWGFKEHTKSGQDIREFGYRFTIASDAEHEVPVT